MALPSDKIQVMLVDDSAVVRGLMQRALKAEDAMEVVATAVDGAMAMDVLKRQPVDVIILDIEMPVMDGLTALPELLRISPSSKVIIASTLTLRNAEISLRALSLGATDYIPKPSASNPSEVEDFYRQLVSKIKTLGAKKTLVAARREPLAVLPAAAPLPVAATPVMATANALQQVRQADAIAIACSTGGPQALLSLFAAMKELPRSVPIFITQHMPPNFTTILADHISKTVGGDCHEAKDGELVQPGVIYVAPGDFHMLVERKQGAVVLRVTQDPPENFCRPAADPMLRSLASVYGKKLLTAVLTGMGSDGAKGAAEVVAAGGTVVAQHEASCVVYGMPKAVVDAKLASAVLPLDQIAPYFLKAMGA